MLVFTTSAGHLQGELKYKVYTPYNVTWSRRGDVLVLTVWGHNMPGKEHAVEFCFQVEREQIKLTAVWIKLRSDELYQISPDQHLRRALEIQERIMKWLRKRPYARQVTVG